MTDVLRRMRLLVPVVVAGAALLAISPAAAAESSGGPPAPYSATVTGARAAAKTVKPRSSDGCSVTQTALNLLNPFSSCQPVRQALGAGVNAVTSLPGTLAGAAATGIMDQVTGWMVQAAQTITGWVFKQAGAVTSPQLEASWFLRLFSGLAALGVALAGLVGLIALGSAAIRKDPDALGEVIYGVGRAGIGTSVVVALTVIALAAADGIANAFARQMPADFYHTLASQWGGSGWGGFGAAALAFLVAFLATIAGLLVWLELIVREAAIYIAVLFFPVALAASIWPALRMWVRRLGMLLLMFVMLRPVVVIVLALAGSVTASGLSFGNGSIPHSVLTILAGVVIFALAGFTPWVLMFLVGAEVGAMQSRASAGGAAGSRNKATSGTENLGGTLAGGGALASGEPAMAGAAVGNASANGGGGGGLISSLGGSGAARSTAGPVAAAAGWVGEAAGAMSRAGGHLSQHAAARIHAAAGRSGTAPAGLLPPSNGSATGPEHKNGVGGLTTTSDANPEPAATSPSFAESVNQPSPGDPGSGAQPPDPPTPTDTALPARRAKPPSSADEEVPPPGPISGNSPPSPPRAKPLPQPDSAPERPQPRQKSEGDGPEGEEV